MLNWHIHPQQTGQSLQISLPMQSQMNNQFSIQSFLYDLQGAGWLFGMRATNRPITIRSRMPASIIQRGTLKVIKDHNVLPIHFRTIQSEEGMPWLRTAAVIADDKRYTMRGAPTAIVQGFFRKTLSGFFAVVLSWTPVHRCSYSWTLSRLLTHRQPDSSLLIAFLFPALRLSIHLATYFWNRLDGNNQVVYLAGFRPPITTEHLTCYSILSFTFAGTTCPGVGFVCFGSFFIALS